MNDRRMTLRAFIVTTTITLGVFCFGQNNAHAMAVADPVPLSQSVANAQVIVAAKIVRYTPDPSQEAKPFKVDPTGRPVYSDFANFYRLGNLKLPGHYEFAVLSTLKGQCSPVLKLDVGYIIKDYYGYANFHVEPNDIVLLMLTTDAKGQLRPVDANVPLIPVIKPDYDLSADASSSVQARVDRLMLFSLSDPIYRRANTFLLREVVDSQITAGLVEYLDDPDLRTRDNVLSCLAANQQVMVIPIIANLAKDPKTHGMAHLSVAALQDYRTPAAIRYLNPLLIDSDYSVRLSAMFTEDHLVDRTSVPYLLLTMFEPDPQQIIPSSAFAMLCKLVPGVSLPDGMTDTYFHARVNDLAIPIYAWWRDELLGLHLTKTQAAEVLHARKLPTTVGDLNPLLFNPDPKTRQAAILSLQKLGDRTSIPYLLLALHDPNTTIAYTSYQILHHLIPVTGAANPESYFQAHRDDEVKVLYAWWQDELLNKHLANYRPPLPR